MALEGQVHEHAAGVRASQAGPSPGGHRRGTQKHSSQVLHATALEALPQPKGRVATWPIATLLLFFAQPDRHMFLKPGIAQQAEERLGFHLNYQPTPNWRTYAQLLSLSEVLFEQLKPLGARDYIDVQSFMWIASKPEEPGTSPKPK